MPIYCVTNKRTGEIRLVEAPLVSTAISHLAKETFTAEACSAKQVADLLTKGGLATVEVAGKAAA